MELQHLIFFALSAEFIALFIWFFISVFIYGYTKLSIAYNILTLIFLTCFSRYVINEVKKLEKKWNIITLYWMGIIFSIISGCIGNILLWTQYEQLMKSLLVYITIIINNIIWSLYFILTTKNIMINKKEQNISYLICGTYFLLQSIINIIYDHNNKLALAINIIFIIMILIIIIYYNYNFISKNDLDDVIEPLQIISWLTKPIAFSLNIIVISSILCNRINQNALKIQIYTFVTTYYLLNTYSVINKIINIIKKTTNLYKLIREMQNELNIQYDILKLFLSLMSIHMAVYYNLLAKNPIFVSTIVIFMVIIILLMIKFRYNLELSFNKESVLVSWIIIFFVVFIILDICSIVFLCISKNIDEINIVIVIINIFLVLLITILTIYGIIFCLSDKVYKKCEKYIKELDLKLFIWEFSCINILVEYLTKKSCAKQKRLLQIILIFIALVTFYSTITNSSTKKIIFYVSLIISSMLLVIMLMNVVNKKNKLLKMLCAIFILFILICYVMINLIIGQEFARTQKITINFISIFASFQYIITLFGIIIGAVKVLRNIWILVFWIIYTFLIIHLTFMGAYFTTNKILSYYGFTIIVLLESLRKITPFVFKSDSSVSPVPIESNQSSIQLVDNSINNDSNNNPNIIEEDNKKDDEISFSHNKLFQIIKFVVSYTIIIILSFKTFATEYKNHDNLNNPLYILSFIPMLIFSLGLANLLLFFMSKLCGFSDLCPKKSENSEQSEEENQELPPPYNPQIIITSANSSSLV
jgi:hypothetical protein